MIAIRDVELCRMARFRGYSGPVFRLLVEQFDAAAGTMALVTGASGSGKSSFLELLGLATPPQGHGRYDLGDPAIDVAALWNERANQTLDRLRRDHLGFVLQQGGLLPALTVRQNIVQIRRLTGRQAMPLQLFDLIERLGLGDLLDRRPAELSIGQRQRVAIVRAVANDAAVIIADEPTSALDATLTAEVFGLLRTLVDLRGATVIVASHDHGPAAALCDRQWLLRQDSDGTSVLGAA